MQEQDGGRVPVLRLPAAWGPPAAPAPRPGVIGELQPRLD